MRGSAPARTEAAVVSHQRDLGTASEVWAVLGQNGKGASHILIPSGIYVSSDMLFHVPQKATKRGDCGLCPSAAPLCAKSADAAKRNPKLIWKPIFDLTFGVPSR